MNFWAFCNNNYSNITEIQTRVNKKAESQKQLETEVNDLSKEVETLRKNRAEDNLNESNYKEKIASILAETKKLHEVLHYFIGKLQNSTFYLFKLEGS
jgi:septal ring factor EnvC (AmiA/AmiB activator)